MGGFHQSFRLEIWIPILSFGAFSCFILILSLSFVIYQFHGNEKINKTIKLYSLLALTFILIAQIFNHLYIINVKFPDGNLIKFTESFFGIWNSFWALAYFFTYLLFFERLRQTFHSTIYKVSKCSSIIFFILLFCYVISQQITSIIWFIFVSDTINWETFNSVYGPSLWLRITIDTILNIYIVYLFCSKIFKITTIKIMSRSTSTLTSTPKSKSSTSDSIRKTSSFKNEHSSKVFNVMIKYFLLTFLTVLSTQIFTASQIVKSVAIDYAVKTGSFEFYYMAYRIHFTLVIIDSMISTIYIILTFPFAEIWYQKYCNCLHTKCVSIWSPKSTLTYTEDTDDTNNNNTEMYVIGELKTKSITT